MKNARAAVAAASLLGAIVAGCAGGGTGGAGSDQVVVRNDTDPYNLAAAQQIADQQCAGRGAGRAQFVLFENSPRSSGGQNGGGGGGPPDIIFRCAPPAGQAQR